jgi:hypothetical protein
MASSSSVDFVDNTERLKYFYKNYSLLEKNINLIYKEFSHSVIEFFFMDGLVEFEYDFDDI